MIPAWLVAVANGAAVDAGGVSQEDAVWEAVIRAVLDAMTETGAML